MNETKQKRINALIKSDCFVSDQIQKKWIGFFLNSNNGDFFSGTTIMINLINIPITQYSQW